MPHDNQERREDTEALAKRSGRDSANPRNQPGEFADDLATNRFERSEEEEEPGEK